MAPLPPQPMPTLDAIYAAYVAEDDDGFRDHLGASIIGKECERALWYDFRWATRRAFSGRMLRLFETGKREEDRLVRDLRRTSATVLDTDPATQALHVTSDLAHVRFQMYVQGTSELPLTFIIVVVIWLIILFAGYGLIAARNPTVLAFLFAATLSVSGAVFLIQELAAPFGGVVRVSEAPLREVIAHLGG